MTVIRWGGGVLGCHTIMPSFSAFVSIPLFSFCFYALCHLNKMGVVFIQYHKVYIHTYFEMSVLILVTSNTWLSHSSVGHPQGGDILALAVID